MIEFLAANWHWMVFVIAMVAMHRRGGCGGHSHGHGGRQDHHTNHHRQPDLAEHPIEHRDDPRRVS